MSRDYDAEPVKESVEVTLEGFTDKSINEPLSEYVEELIYETAKTGNIEIEDCEVTSTPGDDGDYIDASFKVYRYGTRYEFEGRRCISFDRSKGDIEDIFKNIGDSVEITYCSAAA